MNKPTLIVTLAGVCAMLAAVGWDGRLTPSDLRAGGAVAVMTGLALFVAAKASKPVDQCARYELGHRDGHRVGYDEGRRIGRPVVVRLAPQVSAQNVDGCGAGGSCCRSQPVDQVTGRGGGLDSPEWSGDGSA